MKTTFSLLFFISLSACLVIGITARAEYFTSEASILYPSGDGSEHIDAAVETATAWATESCEEAGFSCDTIDSIKAYTEGTCDARNRKENFETSAEVTVIGIVPDEGEEE